jgi:hypothetical protein
MSSTNVVLFVDETILPINITDDFSDYLFEEKNRFLVLGSWLQAYPEYFSILKKAEIVTRGWDEFSKHVLQEAKNSKEHAIKHLLKQEILSQEQTQAAILQSYFTDVTLRNCASISGVGLPEVCQQIFPCSFK